MIKYSSQSLLLMRKCFGCHSEYSASNNWYHYLGDERVLCTRCYSLIYRRNTGKFQNFKEKFKQRICSECKSNKTQVTITKKGYPHTKWVSDGKGGYLCHKCAKRVKYAERERSYSKNKIKFIDRIIHLKHNPRTGYCSWCPNNVFDGTCKATQIHHIEYHEGEFLKDAIELCASCHRKETIRLSRVAKKSEY